MEVDYDVIVVGAGFGGPVAAKLCAEANLKTLLIERSENIGEKIISGLTIPFYGFLFGPAFIRDGNPPIERPADGITNYIITDIDAKDIRVDDSLRIPEPFSPVIAFGYNAYCKPFCEWEVKKALESGVELKTSTTVIGFKVENGIVKGVITEYGEILSSKIVIDAEGSQGLLAVTAGIREKYPPEAISLADTYDYVMNKEAIDRIFGYTLRFCWSWNELKMTPPLGHGNGLMVWPYRNSLHFMQDQCLRLNGKKVPNLKTLFKEYHNNITTKLPWWKREIAPRAKLRAKIWQGFEIYVGLNEKLRNMPNHTDGLILIGDAAGLESTDLCDGVPSAWFSAEIAAKVAIQAIRNQDVSKSFLMNYDQQIKTHPIIQWSISGKNRFNLRNAQKVHDLELLKAYIHNAWGLGSLTHFTTPLFRMALKYLRKDPTIISRWIKLFFRYYQNWIYERYDFSKDRSTGFGNYSEPKFMQFMFQFSTRLLENITKLLLSSRLIMKLMKHSGYSPIILNYFVTKYLPVLEPKYSTIIKLLSPISKLLSRKLISFVKRANPLTFKV